MARGMSSRVWYILLRGAVGGSPLPRPTTYPPPRTSPAGRVVVLVRAASGYASSPRQDHSPSLISMRNCLRASSASACAPRGGAAASSCASALATGSAAGCCCAGAAAVAEACAA